MSIAQHISPQPFARGYIKTFIRELLVSPEGQPSPDATEILWKASSRFIARKNIHKSPQEKIRRTEYSLKKRQEAITEIAKIHGHESDAEAIWSHLKKPFADRINQQKSRLFLFDKAPMLKNVFRAGPDNRKRYSVANLFKTLLDRSSNVKAKTNALTVLWGGSCALIKQQQGGDIMNINHHRQTLHRMAKASGHGEKFDALWTHRLEPPFRHHISKLKARSQAKPIIENRTAAGIPLDLQAGNVLNRIFDNSARAQKKGSAAPTYKRPATKLPVERIGVVEPVFLDVDPQVRARTKKGQENDPRGIRIYSFSPELNRHAIVSNHPELPVLIIEGQKDDTFFEGQSYEQIKAHPDTRTIYAAHRSTFENHIRHALTTPFSEIPKPSRMQNWSGTFNAVAQTCRSLKDAGFDGIPNAQRHKTIAQFFEENKIDMLAETRKIAHRTFTALDSAIRRRQKNTDEPVIRRMPKNMPPLDEAIRTVYEWAPSQQP
ncbi:MAG: hypothetical protein R3E13_09925 [Alphaproteobacteria bacterium]